MLHAGLFDPHLVPKALFDEGLEAEGWFDGGLLVMEVVPPVPPRGPVRIFKRFCGPAGQGPVLTRVPSTPLDRVVNRPLGYDPFLC